MRGTDTNIALVVLPAAITALAAIGAVLATNLVNARHETRRRRRQLMTDIYRQALSAGKAAIDHGERAAVVGMLLDRDSDRHASESAAAAAEEERFKQASRQTEPSW